MSDLEEFNTNISVISDMIMEYHKKRGDSEKPRTYLGASIIGTECDRSLWYEFRHCVRPDFSGRLYRLFETGNLEEPRFIGELKALGLEVVDGEESGKQIGVSAVYGHFKGHLDGAAKGVPEGPKTWHVLEVKTHSDKSFNDVKKKGVKVSKPLHYAQMMVYMGKTGMTRALYLAKNKNTDEIYAERIRYNADEFKTIMDRAERIVFSTRPPERLTSRPDDFRCQFCDAKELCWGMSTTKAVPLPFKGCRSCCHATPTKDGDGAWKCEFHKFDLTFEKQLSGCNKHIVIPDLVHFAQPMDAGEDWVEYKNNDSDVHWRNGSSAYNTDMLIMERGPLDATETVPFDGGNDVPFGDDKPADIFDRYPPEDCRLLWEGSNDATEIEVALSQLHSDLIETGNDGDANRSWWEYDGKYLLVCYAVEGCAAIFEGVE